MSQLLAHIGHLEITTPGVDASVAFYEEKLGLTTVERRDGKAYLRCWGDYYTYSLVLSGAQSWVDGVFNGIALIIAVLISTLLRKRRSGS